MNLTRALQIGERQVISFVGGGGKTTALFCLAEELTGAGKRVVSTTTTRLFKDQARRAPFVVRVQGGGRSKAEIVEALQSNPHILVVGPDADEEKVSGVDPAFVDELAALGAIDAILVEADGARMRPWKAPAEHEPVVPSSTTILIPMVGIDALGLPLVEEHIHRADRVAALAGVPLGTVIDPALVARVTAHAQGGLKNRPAQARVIPFINKVENVAQLLSARDLAGQLLVVEAIEAVAIGAVQRRAMPVSEIERRVSAVVLAAGGSTRMNGPLKQLLPWGDSTLVRHTVELARRAQVQEIVVVAGNQAEAVRQAVEGSGARVVYNPDWKQGRATSVRSGVEAVSARAAAAIFVNADQPFLTTNVLNAILQRYFQTLAPIVAPVYNRQTGSPVLFGRAYFDELSRLEGESGGKPLVEAHREEVEQVNIIDIRAAVDVDTPEQYLAARAEAESPPAESIAAVIHPKEDS